jgi:hypothetical protein
VKPKLLWRSARPLRGTLSRSVRTTRMLTCKR